MSILVVLMPLAVLLGVGFVVAFVYAVRTGQYDDLDTPAHRVLIDDAKTDSDLKKKISNSIPTQGSAERI